ncbi:hypothetical protein L7F22_003699 [Adiantum nelumboides]|nr:hypothetical protein [Adiantum nelumboides]
MAQSSSKKRIPKSVDATGSTPSPWYLDFHLPSGKSDERVHFFFKDKEQSPFKDCGVVKEINKDSSNLDMSPCLGVKVQNGDRYLLEPMAFTWESLKESSDGETMIKARWIEIKEDTPNENLMDMFIEGFKKVIQYLANLKAQNSKKQKNEGTSQVNQKKALKESEAPSVGNSTGMVEQESLSLLEEKDLDKDVKKTNKSGLDGYIGIEHYFKFGVQFTQLINVDQCNLAPDHFKCRPLSGVYVKFLLRQFAKHSRLVSNAVDLMPYDPINKETLKANQVHTDKLATYHYWILSGQHSIIAARAFLRNKSMKSHYNITDEIYNSLFISCTQWLHLKLQKTKETPAIPKVTKGYLQWIIAQKNGISRLQFSLPWTIKCVGKNLEGIEFIQGENTSTVRVDVCIIDTTHKGTICSGWSAAQFGKVIDGVSRIAHQPSEFVIVGLVKYQHVASLEKAISEKAKWYELYALPLGSLIAAAGTAQPTALREVTFGVWAFFSQEEQFTNHSSLKESLFQPMFTLGIDDNDEFDALTIAKSFFVRRAIKCICLKEDDKVVDIFSLGYGTKEVLLQQRKVILVACTNEQMIDLEALCHSTIDEVMSLKGGHVWSLLHKMIMAKTQRMNNIDEPLDAETDAILELLQETVLQQNFTVNNVSCEVIDTKDAPAVEPIDEESINPHLNQQACKEDDKEIQVSKGQPLQLLETKFNDTMEVDDDASSKTCRRTEKDSTKNILVAQDLSTRVHGCIEFLKSLLSISNVGIWSAANDTQVMQIIKILEKEAGEQFPFFMIWGQSQCQQCVESRITRPDNPGVEAFFKPLAIASTKFGIDLKRLLLIDDAPLNRCINPALNCIFPPSFNIDEEDNILLGELLPYTKALHHVNDIRIITGSSLYEQAPIVQGHDLYNHVQKVAIEWKECNLVCLQKTYSTSRLPEAPRVLDDENGASSSTTGMSTRSRDKKRLTLDREKMRILKNIESISSLKGVELIMLAQKLGYKELVIKADEAKNYIKQLKSQYCIS